MVLDEQERSAYTVDTDNENYSSIDGILYNKDGTHLIHYPQNRDAIEIFEIPSTVTTISPKAFDSNKKLLAILATLNVDYMEEANWGAQSRTIVIDNRLEVEIASITYDENSGNHTIVLNDTAVVQNEITQTGASGTLFDEVVVDSSSSEHILLYSKNNKWIVLDRSTTYAYAVLDSNNVLHIYNNGNNTIPTVGASFGEGLTVKGVYKTPTIVPGTLHLDDSYESWSVLDDTEGRLYEITKVVVEEEICPSILSSWFQNFRGCAEFDLAKMNTSRVTAMNNMFHACWGVESLNLTHFETKHVTTMDGMFSSCSKLTKLDLSSFSNENLKSINAMLNTSNLETVYVGEKWLPKITMSGTPFGGTKLTGSKGTIFQSGANTVAYHR